MKKNYQTGTTRAGTGRVTPKRPAEKKTSPAVEVDDVGLPAWALPESVTLAMADLAGTAREGLLALAVGTGLQVMQVLMEQDVTAVVGPKGRWNPDRVAVRHGSDDGEVTLGGRRVPVQRPRMRNVDGTGEVAVPSYELFSSTEVLGRMAMERILAKLSARRYPLGLEPVGPNGRGPGPLDVEVGGVPSVRGCHRDRAGRPVGRRPVGAGSGGVHGRRGPFRRSLLHCCPGDRT